MDEKPSKKVVADEQVVVPPKKSSKKNKTVLIVIAVIVGLLVLGSLAAAALGWFAYNKANDAIGDAIEQSQNENDSNDNDASMPESLPLPDGYPSTEAPIYQPSTITYASKIGDGWVIAAESRADINAVTQSIYDTYQSLGAKVTQTPLNEEGVGQVAGGNAGYGVIITYNTDNEKNVTSISYNVSPQPKR